MSGFFAISGQENISVSRRDLPPYMGVRGVNDSEGEEKKREVLHSSPQLSTDIRKLSTVLQVSAYGRLERVPPPVGVAI